LVWSNRAVLTERDSWQCRRSVQHYFRSEMDLFIQSTITAAHLELQIKFEVYNTLRDVVELVEAQSSYSKLHIMHEKFTLASTLNEALVKKVTTLEVRCDKLKDGCVVMRQKALHIRRQFVNDVGGYLAERKSMDKLKARIRELEQQNQEISMRSMVGIPTILPNDAKADESPPELQEKQCKSLTSASSFKLPKDLLRLQDSPLLHIFSFLQTEEVLNFAQSCRFVYFRIDGIFGIESTIVKPDWGVYSESMTDNLTIQQKQHDLTTVSASIQNDSNILTRDMITSLTKNLTCKASLCLCQITVYLKLDLMKISARNESYPWTGRKVKKAMWSDRIDDY
jgi:polyhydroxyalkanoate synthesis regulator phasin